MSTHLGDILGTIEGGTPAVMRGIYVYTPHTPEVACKEGCPGNMVTVEEARTFVPLKSS